MSNARKLADNLPTEGQLGNRNMLYNGSYDIAQRGTSYQFSNTNATNYGTVDRWAGRSSSGTTLTQSVQSDAPSGFTKSLRYYCDSGGTITQMIRHLQQIEGQDWQHLAYGTADAKDVTLSFWVKSNVTATFTVSLYVYDANEIYTIPYTIDSAGTWEYKTMTFSGNTSGNCNNDNTSGIELAFALGAASGYSSSGVNNAWQSYGASKYATGITGNIGATTGNYWQITGVQLEVGSQSTPFEHEPYETTLRKAQRYYYRLVGYSGTANYMNVSVEASNTFVAGTIPHPTTMRAIPTVSLGSGILFYSAASSSTAVSITQQRSSITNLSLGCTIASGSISGQSGSLWSGNSTGAYIEVDAEI